MPFCATSALPSSCGGANCDDSAENCGESATTQKPQKSSAAMRSPNASSGNNGYRRHISPEPASASAATRALPMRRLHCPPRTQPTPPTAMTAKLSSATEGAPSPRRASATAIGWHNHGSTLQNA
jgi:hypothetical protein